MAISPDAMARSVRGSLRSGCSVANANSPHARPLTVMVLPLTGSRYDLSWLDAGFPPRADFLQKRVEMRDVVLIEKTRGEQRAKPAGRKEVATRLPTAP